MPRIVSRTLYKFQELSDSAKERAISNYRSHGVEFSWESEWTASRKAFEKRIGFSLLDYRGGSIEPTTEVESAYPEWYEFDQEGNHMQGVRLWKWIKNGHWEFTEKEIRRNGKGRCTLTGYCGDCPFFDVFVRFLDKPWKATLSELLYESIQDWETAVQSDEDWNNSDECIQENLEANDYEFTENGEIA